MKTRRLGRSAIHVSEICMGTMTFGSQVEEAHAHRIFDKAFDAGVTFYDCAENYPVPPNEELAGRSEDILGRWMKTKKREQVVSPPRSRVPAMAGSSQPSAPA